MSSFYSRCLSCGVDLPRGCRFCGELCKERWHAKHEGEPVARILTDEWPLVERESEVSGAENTVPCGEGRSDTTGGQDDSVASPTVRSPRSEYYDHKRLMAF